MTTFLAKFNWSRINFKIFKIQRQIAIAWMNNNIDEVKMLQRKLIISYEARLLAVRRVITNQGRKTPGVDNILFETDNQLMEVVNILSNLSKYKAMPVKRVYIPKEHSDELRPLGIPTQFDRAVQALLAIALLPISECRADLRSFGFRPFRSTKDAIQYIYLLSSRNKNPYLWVLEGDIEKCFDSICHRWLLDNVPLPKHLLQETLKSGVLDGPELYFSDFGTPQGGIISPILSNYALDGLENILPEGCKLVRYADDFVIMSHSQEALVNEVMPKLIEFLEERGLKLKESKTKIIHLDEGFDFLGFNFRRYKSYNKDGSIKFKLLVIPAKKKISRIKNKIRLIFIDRTIGKPIDLIRKLNPILRGWSNYYSCVVSSRTFNYVSSYVWIHLWKWIRKLHPTRNATWLVEKYFRTYGKRNWVFVGKNESGNLIKLFYISGVNIVRHQMCKLEMNVFTMEDSELGKVYNKKITGLTILQSKLLNKQKGLCPVCESPLINEDALEVHHILSRKLGGKTVIKNLIILHKFCHYQVTYTKDDKISIIFKNKGIIKDN